MSKWEAVHSVTFDWSRYLFIVVISIVVSGYLKFKFLRGTFDLIFRYWFKLLYDPYLLMSHELRTKFIQFFKI